MNKLTAYLSGPMSGHEDLNEPLFREWEEKLKQLGYHVIVPHDIPAHNGGDGVWEMHMRSDLIHLLGSADFVVTLDGWSGSKGACIEVQLARSLHIPVVHFATVKAAHEMNWPPVAKMLNATVEELCAE